MLLSCALDLSLSFMANLTTDSPISRRIVRSFLDFLSSVEPAPGVDIEGLEVARECLEQIFAIDSFTDDDRTKPDLLADIFGSLGTSNVQERESRLHRESMPIDAPSAEVCQSSTDANHSKKAIPPVENSRSKAHVFGASKDELFGQFVVALEKIQFFRMMPDGSDDPIGVEKATRLFHDAITEMEKSGCHEYNTRNLAETLKSQGNRAMQLKLFPDAIEFYNCAIALCESNAVYYCNRAAAYTQVRNYPEAIRDCLKSIEIDPNYSKAYSRLGTVYFAQGSYIDALNKGFKKALQLDPSNEVVKENIRMAERKLRENQHHFERDWSASSSSQTGSEPHNAASSFGSTPFNVPGLPADFANMFMNMTGNGNPPQAQSSRNRQSDSGDADGSGDPPGVQIGANINFDFGDQMPEDITGALRSVMEMFSGGASPGGNSQDHGGGAGTRPSAPPS